MQPLRTARGGHSSSAGKHWARREGPSHPGGELPQLPAPRLWLQPRPCPRSGRPARCGSAPRALVAMAGGAHGGTDGQRSIYLCCCCNKIYPYGMITPTNLMPCTVRRTQRTKDFLNHPVRPRPLREPGSSTKAHLHTWLLLPNFGNLTFLSPSKHLPWAQTLFGYRREPHTTNLLL